MNGMPDHDLVITNVAEKWASGLDYISDKERLEIALLRLAGCECEFPLIRNSVSFYENNKWESNVGPRCKICNVSVWIEGPTAEQALHYRKLGHQSHKLFLKDHPDSLMNYPPFDDPCFEGCGCG